MNQKEKAKELVDKFVPFSYYHTNEFGEYGDADKESVENAKQCALICIDEEYKARLNEVEKVSEYIPCEVYSQQVIFIKKHYQEVKKEIEKL